METVRSDACVRFDDKNVQVHRADDAIDWNTVFPDSLWYTRDDYNLFQRRDDLIVSLVNGDRFYETSDHTYRGLESNEYDRYRKSISRRLVTSEQDRQRASGVNDPLKISDIYQSICSHSAQQARVRGIHDALVARADACCLPASPTASNELFAELYSPQRLRARTVPKFMNPSMISSMNAEECSRRPPCAPRSSNTVEMTSNMMEYQPNQSPSDKMNRQSPQFATETASYECISVESSTIISPVITHQTGTRVQSNTSPESLKLVFSKVDSVISPHQKSKSKTLRSISRKRSPKQAVDSPYKDNANSPLTTVPKNHNMNINLLS